MADDSNFSVLRAGGAHQNGDRVHKSGPPAIPGLSAPAGNTPTQRSCVTCRRRKVKCDKKNPCSNCTKARIECVFPSSIRAPRKPRRPADSELLERLKKLEGALQSLGAQVDEDDLPSPDIPDVPAPAETNPDFKVDDDRQNFKLWRKVGSEREEQPRTQDACPQQAMALQRSDTNFSDVEARFGRLVVTEGKSRYINNSFWASLNNEVEDLKGILNDLTEDEEDYPSPDSSENTTLHQGFIFGFSSTTVNMLALHPIPSLIPRIWNLFKENVDPLVKILHIPTLEPTILEARERLDNLPRGLEALIFAIYYSVVTSMQPSECRSVFGETQQVLLTRYRFALEQALARAGFLDSEELIVLQAFVIFLIVLRRNDDARVIWTLTGLVVRMAQTLGIHRDGSHFALAPFEIEMRRRLWWQVCILDARASEDHGCDPTIVEAQFDTQMPLNVNDSDLSPEITELPESRKGFTEMTFCLVRFEVANIFRRILYVPPGPEPCTALFANLTIEQKEKWIGDCHQRMEDTYLKDADLSVPLYWVAATLSRLVLSKMWLVVYHPYQRLDGGKSLPQEIKDKLFITSLESVEYANLLDTDPRTQKWGWLFRTYVQWHSIAFMLSELCKRTSGPLVMRAWRAIEGTVSTRFGNTLTDPRRTVLWRPLRKLMIKARRARQMEVIKEAHAVGVHIPVSAMVYPAIDSLLSPSSMPPGSSDTPMDSNSLQNRGIIQNWDSSAFNSENRASSSPSTTRLPPGVNLAAQQFTNLANAGMDWLLEDMINPQQSTTPDVGHGQPQLNASPPGFDRMHPTRSNSSGNPGDEMNWESWDDLVKEFTDGPTGTNTAIGMGVSTWF